MKAFGFDTDTECHSILFETTREIIDFNTFLMFVGVNSDRWREVYGRLVAAKTPNKFSICFRLGQGRAEVYQAAEEFIKIINEDQIPDFRHGNNDKE